MKAAILDFRSAARPAIGASGRAPTNAAHPATPSRHQPATQRLAAHWLRDADGRLAAHWEANIAACDR